MTGGAGEPGPGSLELDGTAGEKKHRLTVKGETRRKQQEGEREIRVDY